MQRALPLIFLLMVLHAATTPLHSTAGAVSADNAQAYELTAAYLNPYNNSTTFSLAVNHPQHVLVEFYNLLGERLSVVYDVPIAANVTRVLTLDAGNLLCGIYLYRASGRDFVATRQVTLMR